MPNLDEQNTAAYWISRKLEIQEELALMVGRPGFSVAGLGTDEAENYNRLKHLELTCDGKINELSGVTAATRSVRDVGGAPTW